MRYAITAFAVLSLNLRTVQGKNEDGITSNLGVDLQVDGQAPITVFQSDSHCGNSPSANITSLNELDKKLQRIINFLGIGEKTREGDDSKLDGRGEMTDDGGNVLNERGKNEGGEMKDEERHKIPPGEERNCADRRSQGDNASGVRIVYPSSLENGLSVFCDQTTDDGGYTLIQRRDVINPREDFDRNWIDYKTGFGNINGEFWLGLDNMHALTSETPMEIRFNLWDWEGTYKYAVYDYFYVASEVNQYRVTAGNYSGTAGDAFNSHHKGHMFSTKDRDNDPFYHSLAVMSHSGWWFGWGYHSSLNGLPHKGGYAHPADGIIWHHFRYSLQYSLMKTNMGIRPKTRKN